MLRADQVSKMAFRTTQLSRRRALAARACAHVPSIEKHPAANHEEHRQQQQNRPDELQKGESPLRLLHVGDDQIRVAPELAEAIQCVFWLVGNLYKVVGMPAQQPLDAIRCRRDACDKRLQRDTGPARRLERAYQRDDIVRFFTIRDSHSVLVDLRPVAASLRLRDRNIRNQCEKNTILRRIRASIAS